MNIISHVVVVGVQDDDRKIHFMELVDVRQHCTGLETVVDDESAGPLSCSNYPRPVDQNCNLLALFITFKQTENIDEKNQYLLT